MCAGCGYEKLLSQIDELVSDPDYEWATDTLEGIQETVEERRHCTINQKTAVDNIERRGR